SVSFFGRPRVQLEREPFEQLSKQSTQVSKRRLRRGNERFSAQYCCRCTLRWLRLRTNRNGDTNKRHRSKQHQHLFFRACEGWQARRNFSSCRKVESGKSYSLRYAASYRRQAR